MPPKNAPPKNKKEEKKKQEALKDKTFGMKNKKLRAQIEKNVKAFVTCFSLTF
jgi:hypothetical protein